MKHYDNPETAKHTKETEQMLQQNKNASADDKKKLMRELQLKYHPDKNDDPLAKDSICYSAVPNRFGARNR